MTPELLAALRDDITARRPVTVATHLATQAQRRIGPADTADPLAEAVATALRSDRPQQVEDDDGVWFVRPYNPPLRMIVVGAVHIAQALAPMAALVGYEVTVVDPRRAFATGERFPGVAVDTDWPDDALRRLSPDRRTAVVTLTHDPKLDDPALEAALASEAFYIGSLGSRRTHAARLERLRASGFDEPALARIHGPIGLAIGARSPAEIAIAVIAEVTTTLRKPAAAETR